MYIILILSHAKLYLRSILYWRYLIPQMKKYVLVINVNGLYDLQYNYTLLSLWRNHLVCVLERK